jgi:hypothetical protein
MSSSKKTQKAAVDLSNRGLFVDVDVRLWDAEIQDHRANDQLAEHYHTAKTTYRTHKKFFPDGIAPEWEKPCSIISDAYKYFVRHTVPWGYGVRLMKATFFGDFNRRIKEFSVELSAALTELEPVIPELKERSRNKLNGGFKDEEWPTTEYILGRFGIAVKYMPVVAPGDFRLELDDTLLNELKKQHQSEFMDSQTEMLRKLWKRVYTTVERAAKLRDKEVKVYESVFKDIDELADVLPFINMMDDPNLDKLGKEIKQHLSGRDVKEVRKNETEREEVALQAQKLVDKMSKLMPPD